MLRGPFPPCGRLGLAHAGRHLLGVGSPFPLEPLSPFGDWAMVAPQRSRSHHPTRAMHLPLHPAPVGLGSLCRVGPSGDPPSGHGQRCGLPHHQQWLRPQRHPLSLRPIDGGPSCFPGSAGSIDPHRWGEQPNPLRGSCGKPASDPSRHQQQEEGCGGSVIAAWVRVALSPSMAIQQGWGSNGHPRRQTGIRIGMDPVPP